MKGRDGGTNTARLQTRHRGLACLHQLGQFALARGTFGREGAWRSPLVGTIYVTATALVRRVLEPEVVVRLRDEGLSMPEADALAYALAR